MTKRSELEYKLLYAVIVAEQVFLSEADRLGMHPVDLDQKLWLERNKSGIRE